MNSETRTFTAATSKLAYAQAFSRPSALSRSHTSVARRRNPVSFLLPRRSR